MSLLFALVLAVQDPPKIGDVVADMEIATLDGKTVKLSDHRGKEGKTVVIFFWSTNCPTGRDQRMEKTTELSEYCAKNDVVFIPVSAYGESKDEIEEWTTDNKFTTPISLDKGGATAKKFGAKKVSHTAILDKDGKLVFSGGLFGKIEGERGVKNLAVQALEQLKAGKEISTPSPGAIG
jgi:peroxiredoxin